MKLSVFKNDIPEDFILFGDIAIDTETMGLNIHRDRLCLIQISDQNQNACIVQFDGDGYRATNLAKLLLDPTRVKIFHFARFDVVMIKIYLGIEMNNIFCTKVASYLTRTYTDSHGLKELCREFLGIQLSKQQQSSDWSASNLSEEQKDYAIRDVIYLHRIKNKLEYMLKKTDRLEIAKKIFEFIPTRCDLDILGWNDIDVFAHTISTRNR